LEHHLQKAAPISSSVFPALTAASTNPAEILALSLSSNKLYGISIPNFSPNALILSDYSELYAAFDGAASSGALDELSSGIS